eukprot:jgi/Mesvir1/20375/Mv25327-RA.1
MCVLASLSTTMATSAAACCSAGRCDSAAAPLATSFTQRDARLGFAGAISGVRFPVARPTPTHQLPVNRRCQTVAMAKKVTAMVKLALTAGKATPAPPVGPALGSKGVNIMGFCKEYNAATQDKAGMVVPVEITVYDDRSFTFVLKTPPASVLLKTAAGVSTGSATGANKTVGSITKAQLKEIAATKLPDLNANDLDAAMRIVGGTARNMGITIKE